MRRNISCKNCPNFTENTKLPANLDDFLTVGWCKKGTVITDPEVFAVFCIDYPKLIKERKA